jgi:hypothetical protein
MLVSDEVSNIDTTPSKIKISGQFTYFFNSKNPSSFLIAKIC